MSEFFYKSSEPATVAIVREFYAQKDVLIAQMTVLGSMFGGKAAPMRDLTSHYAGGVKLNGGIELDAHWCRPDDYGYRSLRSAAKLAKGMSKEDRTASRAEHERRPPTRLGSGQRGTPVQDRCADRPHHGLAAHLPSSRLDR